MKRFVDPFFPSRPVNDPNRFSGRIEQIDDIVDSLFQLVHQNPVHTIITGDRGIGKSSLLLQTKILAEGNNSLIDKFHLDIGNIEHFNFITSWYDADYGQTASNVAYGLLANLQDSVSTILKKFNIELDLGGFVKISKSVSGEKTLSDIVAEFCNQIKKVSSKISSKNDGILLFIDEIDRLDSNSGIATFLKLCTEKFVRDNITNVAFFCAGIKGSIQSMKEEHASITRTFKDVLIPKLTQSETSEILLNGFNKLNVSYDTKISDLTYKLCVGFPEPVHLLGSQMLHCDSDKYIGLDDFEHAKEQVVKTKRKNELEGLLKKAGYGKYQTILEAMADCDNVNVSIDYISSKLKIPQNEFSTNISNLCKRNIINKIERGVYTFTDPLLKEYIKNFGIIKTREDEIDNSDCL